jgi:ATP-dependent RNA helicase RhlE
VHRIGRTGRAGSTGIAISICDFEEQAYLRDIEKLIGKKIEYKNPSTNLKKVEELAEGAKKDFRHQKKKQDSKRK